jgi:hypothetical protein
MHSYVGHGTLSQERLFTATRHNDRKLIAVKSNARFNIQKEISHTARLAGGIHVELAGARDENSSTGVLPCSDQGSHGSHLACCGQRHQELVLAVS